VRTAAPPLLPVFRSRLQGRLLALVLADPGVEWTVDQLSERTGEPYQTVANEVRRLQAADLVAVRPVGRSKLLRANEDSPYFRPLAQLALMSFGPPLVIGEEFASLEGAREIFIFGSWAARYEGDAGPAPRDVDVLVVGQPDRDAAYDAARRAEQGLGREVNVTIRSAGQWRSGTDGFTRQLRLSPMLRIPLQARGQEPDSDGGDGA
jgi:predicted nucleotidyltransferase